MPAQKQVRQADSAAHSWTVVLTESREWGSGRAERGRADGVANSAYIHVSHGIKLLPLTSPNPNPNPNPNTNVNPNPKP